MELAIRFSLLALAFSVRFAGNLAGTFSFGCATVPISEGNQTPLRQNYRGGRRIAASLWRQLTVGVAIGIV